VLFEPVLILSERVDDDRAGRGKQYLLMEPSDLVKPSVILSQLTRHETGL
jgi:hypothetical protein